MRILPLLGILFTTCLATANDTSQPGTVTFAFDGGTLRCDFGTVDPETKRVAAMILYPSSVSILADKGVFTPKMGVKGSTVLVIDSEGNHIQLDSNIAKDWARNRISEMATRRSSVAENSFVAAVLYTIFTGETLRVWATDGTDALEAGDWSKLFDPTPRKEIDPFGE